MRKQIWFLVLVPILILLVGCGSANPSDDIGVAGGYEGGEQTGAAKDDEVNEEPEKVESVDFEAQYIRTNGYEDGATFPRVVVIRSQKELKEYYSENCDTFDLERKEKVYSDTTIGFLDACDKYDKEYFADQILIMVLLEEGSGSIRHEVTGVELSETGILNISIRDIVPEIGTADMAEWHILIEPEIGVEVNAEQVTVNGRGWLVEVEEDDELETAAMNQSTLTSPPEMKLVVDGNSTPGVMSGYEWTVYSGETVSSAIADSAHSLEMSGTLTAFEVSDENGALAFTDEPQAFSVRCWSDEHWGDTAAESEPVTVIGSEMKLKEGGYIYEVEAKWTGDSYEGVATYVFYVVYTPEDGLDGNICHPAHFVIQFDLQNVVEKIN